MVHSYKTTFWRIYYLMQYFEAYLKQICWFIFQTIFKNHTHVKRVGHTSRIYVWHLLMNLKSNYLLKKTYSGPIKNLRNSTFAMLNFFFWRYFTPACQKSWWYNLRFLRYRVWPTEIGNYGSFFALLPHPPTPTSNQKPLGILSFYTCVT